MAVVGAARAGGGLRLSTLPPQGFDAQDVQPSRLAAAQRAAKEFVAGVPTNVRIGVVSFAGTAAIVQGPTLDRKEVEAAIDRLKLGPSTNLYGGIAYPWLRCFLQLTSSWSISRIPRQKVVNQSSLVAPIWEEAKSSPEAIARAPSSS